MSNTTVVGPGKKLQVFNREDDAVFSSVFCEDFVQIKMEADYVATVDLADGVGLVSIPESRVQDAVTLTLENETKKVGRAAFLTLVIADTPEEGARLIWKAYRPKLEKAVSAEPTPANIPETFIGLLEAAERGDILAKDVVLGIPWDNLVCAFQELGYNEERKDYYDRVEALRKAA